jgi:hypothetical protein
MKCRGLQSAASAAGAWPCVRRGLSSAGFDGPLKEWALTLGEPPRDSQQAPQIVRHLARQG